MNNVKVFKYSLLITFGLSLFASSANALTPNNPITTDQNYHGGPDIYGSNIVYTDVINGQSNAFAYNYHSDKTTPLPDGATNPKIYGNEVVYTSGRTGNVELYLYDLNNKKEQAITSGPGGRQEQTIWGDNIVWADYGNPSNANDIFLYNSKTKITTQITNDSNDEYNPSVGSTWVTWTNGAGNSADIYGYNLKTQQTGIISGAPGAQDHSRNFDNTVVWDDQRRGTDASDVYMKNLDTNDEQLVSDGTDFSGRPDIYDKSIVYVDFSSTEGDIFEYDIPSNQTTQITNDAATQSQPSIYKNSIVWADYRDSLPQIYGNIR